MFYLIGNKVLWIFFNIIKFDGWIFWYRMVGWWFIMSILGGIVVGVYFVMFGIFKYFEDVFVMEIIWFVLMWVLLFWCSSCGLKL